jgi:acyl-CoA thioesterase
MPVARRGLGTVRPVTGDASGLQRALTLRTVGDGHLEADIEPGWDVRGNPHGGYLLALVAEAATTITVQDDPIAVAASYLAPPQFGPAQLAVDIVRAGRRQSTVSVRLHQHERELVRAVVTVGTLVTATPVLHDVDLHRPELPAPEECRELRPPPDGEDIALHQRLLVRVGPEVGWVDGRPSGRPRIDGWLRLAGGREPDPAALLVFSDGFPPSIFEGAGPEIGHVPTVQLTTYLFARPSAGWVQGRFHTRVQGGGFVDEAGELWDADGRLVATTRQLALLR